MAVSQACRPERNSLLVARAELQSVIEGNDRGVDADGEEPPRAIAVGEGLGTDQQRAGGGGREVEASPEIARGVRRYDEQVHLPGFEQPGLRHALQEQGRARVERAVSPARRPVGDGVGRRSRNLTHSASTSWA